MEKLKILFGIVFYLLLNKKLQKGFQHNFFNFVHILASITYMHNIFDSEGYTYQAIMDLRNFSA